MTLAAARINAGLTQEEASKRIGVSRQTISYWETGQHGPIPEHLSKLCEVYNIKEEWLNLDVFKK